MDNDENELGVYSMVSIVNHIRRVSLHTPGTMTSSFFLVLSLNNLTSSSLSRPSTSVPAAFKNDQTKLATSSALCIPPSFRPLANPSVPLSVEAGNVLFGFASELFDINPEVRKIGRAHV